MTEKTTKSAALEFDWQAWIKCPHCRRSFDYSDVDGQNDNIFAKKIFSNQWDDLKGESIDCFHCGEEFQIERVEC